MISLFNNLHILSRLKENIKSGYYTHHEVLNPSQINKDTISIVMTSHERSQQVYHTLKTISNSSIKDVQIVLVDDSQNDPVETEKLKAYNLHIDLIRIKVELKNWANPCVNYNIGFQFIKGGYVIIQNAEVCHVGDVLKFVKNNVDEKYFVFDVRTTASFEINELIYRKEMTTKLLNESEIGDWYHHHEKNNVNYHFLTALTKKTFDLIDGFSLDYSFGTCHDDNDFLLKIQLLKIPITHVKNHEHNVAGIHQYHGYYRNNSDKRAYYSESNQRLYNKKKKFIDTNNKYIEVSDGKNTEEITNLFNILNQY